MRSAHKTVRHGRRQRADHHLRARQGRPADRDARTDLIGRDIGDLAAILRTALPNNDIRVQTVDDTVILTGDVQSAIDAQKAYDIALAFVNYTAVGAAKRRQRLRQQHIVRQPPRWSRQADQRDDHPGAGPGHAQGSGHRGAARRAEAARRRRSAATGSAASRGRAPATPTHDRRVSGAAGIGILCRTGNIVIATRPGFRTERGGAALAEPTVTAISGESAKFTAGGTIPIRNLDRSARDIDRRLHGATTFADYGVSLNFTPTVLSEGRISLHLATEVTEPDRTERHRPYACATDLGFRTRTERDHGRIALGRLHRHGGPDPANHQQAIAGTPGLMNLPILGALFRSRDYQRDESELMIIVTPYIAKTLRPDQIAKPDDGFTGSDRSPGLVPGSPEPDLLDRRQPRADPQLQGPRRLHQRLSPFHAQTPVAMPLNPPRKRQDQVACASSCRASSAPLAACAAASPSIGWSPAPRSRTTSTSATTSCWPTRRAARHLLRRAAAARLTAQGRQSRPSPATTSRSGQGRMQIAMPRGRSTTRGRTHAHRGAADPASDSGVQRRLRSAATPSQIRALASPLHLSYVSCRPAAIALRRMAGRPGFRDHAARLGEPHLLQFRVRHQKTLAAQVANPRDLVKPARRGPHRRPAAHPRDRLGGATASTQGPGSEHRFGPSRSAPIGRLEAQ